MGHGIHAESKLGDGSPKNSKRCQARRRRQARKRRQQSRGRQLPPPLLKTLVEMSNSGALFVIFMFALL